MEINKIKEYLNICHKAGFLIIGGEKLKYYNKKLYLILYDQTSQKNTLKILNKFKNIPAVKIENLDKITSINNCKIVGIKNKSLSELILVCFD